MEHLGDVLGRDLDNLQTFVLETYVQALAIAENFLFNLAVEAEHLDLERGLVRIADCNERGIADKIEGVCTEETAGNDTLSEDLADGTLTEDEAAAKPGLRARLKNFKQSLKGLSDVQKLILLTIAIVLPAGILIAVGLASFIKKRKK